jgi:hypothetical protein
MRSRCLGKIAIWLGFTAAFWPGAKPALAYPTLIVANPHPNDRVITGSLVMQGVAYDPDAADGPGIDRVSVSLCGRDGNHLGDAVLGLPSSVSVERGDPRFANAGWKATILLKGAGEARSLCVSAVSSYDSEETVVRIPLTIGETPPPPPGPKPEPEAVVAAPDEATEPAAPPTKGTSSSKTNGTTAPPIGSGSGGGGAGSSPANPGAEEGP